jgi:hypothetical protein
MAGHIKTNPEELRRRARVAQVDETLPQALADDAVQRVAGGREER